MTHFNQTPTTRIGAVRPPFSVRKNPVALRRTRTTAAAATGIVSMLAVSAFVGTPAVAEPINTAASTGVFLAPYYTELDLTGDEQVTSADLELLAQALGATATSPSWAAVSTADVDVDGTITLTDIATVSTRIIYDDGPFDLIEATTIDMQAAMNAGVTSSVELTQAYLDRIDAYDRVKVDPATTGRALNSIISTNSTALAAAAAADATRAAEGMTSMLLGIPLAVKDNYNTKDMPTTAGCSCWDGNQTSDDAFMVEGLRAAGSVILAKASLDEFALGFSSAFSSFQEPGASLLVASPYNTTRTAGGSSGGTGAAIAANLAGIGFGSDTGGSIRVPSSYNQLVGIRPTVGLSSRDGIVPLALTQDTGGPIARSVTDAAVALDAVVGVDPADPITAEQTGLVPDSYTEYLDPTALQGTRIGYVASMVGTNATVLRLWNEALDKLRAQGAEIVVIPSSPTLTATLDESSGSTNEFKHDLAIYTQTYLNPAVTARSIPELLASGRMVPNRSTTYTARENVTEEAYQRWAGPTGTHTAAIATGSTFVTSLLDDNNLDSIIYPSTGQYTTISTNMRLSPNTGMPSVTVPMGQSIPTDAGAVAGAGVNLEFLGRNYDEGTLIGLTYAFEQATHARTTPALYGALPTR
ncbi:Asp-tRNA(Asn)/Glu-tRNA(Gln) amidotransferase A subunit family amidase [Glaciihabitans tibetensis]|uniref:Asp-tRNA(Asn)/Glu-tRNA(Gln) amidotransferase A subunit family amidase n=1 Tax=Glaciihabitans tibetensis TaxID=1266600 RepID=A0A2T0VA01_9MICO|nr:Asp-tRNA(Asn)/Glu-tRNA(Gln) amidotransferase A subunit family amidase [Glaciihabitans tibetensis]